MLSVNIHNFNVVGSLLLSDKMEFDINIFSPLMMSRMMNQTYGVLIIA
jgi:hypothetical protein